MAVQTFAVGPPCGEVLPYAAAQPFVVEQPSEGALRHEARPVEHRRLRGHDVEPVPVNSVTSQRQRQYPQSGKAVSTSKKTLTRRPLE